MVCDKEASTGEIIAISTNQNVLPEILGRYKNVVLYSPDPPFPLGGLKRGLGTRL